MLFQNLRPGQLPSSKDLKEVGRQLQRSRPALNEGDASPAGQTSSLTGHGRTDTDKGHVFFAEITNVLNTGSEGTGSGPTNQYEFDEIVYNWTDDETISQVEVLEGGRQARFPDNPAFSMSGQLSIGDRVIARRSFRSPNAYEVILGGRGVGEKMYGRLLSKTYNGLCPVYIYEEVVPDAMCGEHWLTTGVVGLAFEPNREDLPTPNGDSGSNENEALGVIVELFPLGASGSGGNGSSGPTCVFIKEPSVDFVERTSDQDVDGYASGVKLITDGVTVAHGEAIEIVDINELPVGMLP